MPDLSVTIVLPNGGARTAEVPDDVACATCWRADLAAQAAHDRSGRPADGLPDRQQGARPRAARGRDAGPAGVPANDRLILTADITAGANGARQVAALAPPARPITS